MSEYTYDLRVRPTVRPHISEFTVRVYCTTYVLTLTLTLTLTLSHVGRTVNSCLFLAEDGLQLLDVLCLECEELVGLGVEYELHLICQLVR